jgi:VWFA-related protein
MHGARYVLGLLVVAVSVVVAGHAQQQPPTTIRTGVTSVPIDVRVVDRNDTPVTDLKQEDFTVIEEGVLQQIRHFATQAFTADPAAALPEPRFRTTASAPAPATENRRVFLILIGRGRHQTVSKYVDALTRFLADRVLPQDQVALFVWNRATDFTTNREILVRTLARSGAARADRNGTQGTVQWVTRRLWVEGHSAARSTADRFGLRRGSRHSCASTGPRGGHQPAADRRGTPPRSTGARSIISE